MGNELKYWSNYFERAKINILPENYECIKGYVRKIKSTLREQTISHHLQIYLNLVFDVKNLLLN